MYANLVRAPGFDGHLQQRQLRQPLRGLGWQTLAHLDQAHGMHGVRVVFGYHLDAPLTVGQQVFVQRRVDHLAVGRPMALHQRQVGFAGFAFAELVL